MFHDLNDGLTKLFKAHLPPEFGESVSISFAAPDNKFPPSTVALPAIDIFLYDIRENLHLRGKEWFIQQPNGGGKKFHPIQVECSYIITTWVSENISDPTMAEHRLLGEALKVLLKFRTYPDWADEDLLADESAKVVRSQILQPDYIRMGEFWQAMGGKPRVAIHYQITLSVDIHKAGESYPVKDIRRKLIRK